MKFELYKNEIYVDFPLEKDLIILIGENGTYKTKTLEKIKSYFQENGEKVLYFSEERFVNFTKEDIENWLIVDTLSSKNLSAEYDLNKILNYKFPVKGSFIKEGSFQLVNFFYNIYKQEEKFNLIIDTPETNIHLSRKKNLINDLLSLDSVNKLIVATHCPSIIADNYTNDCVFSTDEIITQL